MNNRIYIDQYIMHGLNRHRSFKCTPGPRVRLDTEEKLQKYAVRNLKKTDCQSAVFVQYIDETYSAYIKIYHADDDRGPMFEDEDGDLVFTFAICSLPRVADSHVFAQIDGDFRLCCYSLLLEVEDGIYEVCV